MPPNKRKNWITQLKVQNPITSEWVDLGRWAVLEGAGVTAEESLYHDWDGPVQLGGVRTREAATVRRIYGRNANEIYSQLDAWVGEAQVELARTPTNDRGVTVGETIVYTGVLGGAKLPDSDKGSSDAGEIELTLHLSASLA